MVEYLNRYYYLIRYADLAYRNCDGAEFRALAWELGGNVEGGYRKIDIQLPSFRSAFRFLTVNTHVHLGIRNDDTLVLAFRGTDWPSCTMDLFNPKKWWAFASNAWTDLAFDLTGEIHWLHRNYVMDRPVLIHEGFLYAFNDLLWGEKLEQAIHHLVKDRLGGPTKIEICGHIGTQWPNADVTCVTLGSPRVGNEAFCKLFEDTKTFRIMMDADPIPTVPDRLTQATPLGFPASHKRGTAADRRYRHVGTPIVLWLRFHSPAYGVERHDIEKEEAEPELIWVNKLWLFVYWPIRILATLNIIYRTNHPLDGSIRGVVFSVDGYRFVDVRDRQGGVWAPAAFVRKGISQLESSIGSSEAEAALLMALKPSRSMLDGLGDPEITSPLVPFADGKVVLAGKRNGDVLLFSTSDARQIGVLYQHDPGASIVGLALAGSQKPGGFR